MIKESKGKKFRKYNDLLKNLGVMDNTGNISLKDMMEKINQFLAVNDNKDKFLKKFDDEIKNDIKVKNIKIKVKELQPSQTAIFLDHVLSRLVVNDYDREQILNGELKDHDILISEDNHIIDGHHRWASAFLLNPDCELDCTQIKLPIDYALPIINVMLEISEKITIGRTGDYSVNIFELENWPKERLFKKMNTIISKTIRSGVDLGDKENKLKSKEAWKTNESMNVDTHIGKYFYKNIKKKLDLEKHPLKYMRKNLKKMPNPASCFSGREEMPHIKEKISKKIL